MSNSLLKYWIMNLGDEEPQLQPVYYMTPKEAIERVDLNFANTSSAMRARVVAELAKGNGNSGKTV